MKKLNKKQLAQREEIVEALREKFTEYEEAVDALNAVIGEANDFREEITSAMDDYISERSEKWAESDNGSAYQSWKDDWDNAIEEIEKAEFDPDILDSLPEEPGF